MSWSQSWKHGKQSQKVDKCQLTLKKIENSNILIFTKLEGLFC
jgi:hypothetical protein